MSILCRYRSKVGNLRQATPVESHKPCLSLVNQILHFECMGKAAKKQSSVTGLCICSAEAFVYDIPDLCLD